MVKFRYYKNNIHKLSKDIPENVVCYMRQKSMRSFMHILKRFTYKCRYGDFELKLCETFTPHVVR